MWESHQNPVSIAAKLIVILAVAALHFGCGDSGRSLPPDVNEVEFGELREVNGRSQLDVTWPSDNATMRGTLYFPPSSTPHPAVILHFGSGRWARPDISFGVIDPWLDNGFAVLVYDKRGVGRSSGSCCPVSDPGYFPLLATDLINGIQALQLRPEIIPGLIGLYGFSQGGWILPNAAARSPSVAFTVIGSGPAVSLGEESLYSQLVGGQDECTPTGISQNEIDAELAAAGPSGFDPRQDLTMYTVPGYWFYGENDLSVPVKQSVEVLEMTRDTYGVDFTIRTYPNANHSLIIDGAICQESGQSVDFFTPIFEWLNDRVL